MVKEVTSTQQFEQEVLNSANPVFVDFWVEWCGPCRAVSPAVEELSSEYKDKLDFVKVDVDQNNEIAQKYSVFSIPTLAIFANGKVIAQSAGAASKDSIRSYIDKNVN
ncbi:MAG: thioredoxin [Nitrosopumilaceae archaeon]|uniref:Thioredoxin n=1 Tax=Candidatus Nitrosomaritimum aestuariumsis TaxID=3342354 RepID=A0AC60W2V3_9ARCH|nr:thioredoxin [Nitrosopumilaceae archaeon]